MEQSEFHNPEIEALRANYEKARLRLDSKIKKHLGYRFDLPDQTAAKNDPDYDKFMYRNNVITGFVGQIKSLLNIEGQNFLVKDLKQIEEIDQLVGQLQHIALESIERGAKTPEEMLEIHELVEKLVALCETVVEANNPAIFAAA